MFKYIIIIYSLFTTAILVILYHKSEKIIKNNKTRLPHIIKIIGVKKYFSVIIILIPFFLVSYRVFYYFPSFGEIDTSAYLYDAIQIERVGGIDPYDMREDVYYKGFPIFTLIIVIFKMATSASIFQVYILLNLLYVLLFLIWSYIIYKYLFQKNLVYALVLPLTILGNPYLLASLHYFIPYLLSLTANILFIYLLLRFSKLKNSRAYIITYFLINLLCLNHAELLYFSILILLISVFSRFFDSKELSIEFIILPWVIFWFYIFFNVLFIIRLRVFWEALILNLQSIFNRSVQMIRIESLEHPYPYINAFAYSINISVTLCISLMYIVTLLKGKRIKQISDLLFNILALFLSFCYFLGVLWQFYGLTELGNTLMYTYITAFLLSPVVCLYYIKKVAICHWHVIFFICLLIIGVFGSLTEPLAMPDQNNSYFLTMSKFNQAKSMAHYLCSFCNEAITIYISSSKIIPYLDILCMHSAKIIFNLQLEYNSRVLDLGNLSIFT
ncbi:MAG: hypothetical protein QXF79_01100 [Ignisphaera sp.]